MRDIRAIRGSTGPHIQVRGDTVREPELVSFRTERYAGGASFFIDCLSFRRLSLDVRDELSLDNVKHSRTR